ncbi:MAG: acetylornithine transaminase [Candidatus Binataceae bacterium]
MKSAQIVELAHQYLANTYGCMPLAFERGEGPYLFDAEGNRYLDFFCGLAVTSLGHSHPRVVNAIREQAGKLTHVSNVFHTEPMARLAERLCKAFGGGRVFFCNSGAEANEAAIKLARRWGFSEGGGRFEIISTVNSFHGRTLGALSATGQEKYQQGFQPMTPGFRLFPYNDIAALEGAIGRNTVAVMLEPVQGEGGVVMPAPDYLKRVRQICDQAKVLLILDEVQTGMGRTGRMFAWQHSDVRPDIMSLAKALGGGLPIGAAVARPEIAASLTPGSHGSTFGGNPVSCAAALAVMDVLENEGAIENAAEMGAYMIGRLRQIAATIDDAVEVRGVGMMIAVVMKREAQSIVEACLKERLLVNAAAGNVLRLLPPLILTRAQADEGIGIIERALNQAPRGGKRAA